MLWTLRFINYFFGLIILYSYFQKLGLPLKLTDYTFWHLYATLYLIQAGRTATNILLEGGASSSQILGVATELTSEILNILNFQPLHPIDPTYSINIIIYFTTWHIQHQQQFYFYHPRKSCSSNFQEYNRDHNNISFRRSHRKMLVSREYSGSLVAWM